jgi:hypothetical protein
MALHSNSTANHILESWVYANASARNAATGFVTADVGKIAYQSDTGEYWRLTATTPTWAPVVVGGTFTNGIVLDAGTTTAAPMTFVSGANLTTPVGGSVEFDAAQFYFTYDATPGRQAAVIEQYTALAADGSAIGATIADFFGTNPAFNLNAATRYILEFQCYFLKTTAGTVTWTLTNTQAPVHQNIHFEMSPLTGIVAPAGSVAAYLSGDVVGDTTAAFALTASGSLTTGANHYMRMRVIVSTHATNSSNIRLRATESAGTITPRRGSWQSCRRIVQTVGSFAA